MSLSSWTVQLIRGKTTTLINLKQVPIIKHDTTKPYSAYNLNVQEKHYRVSEEQDKTEYERIKEFLK